MAATLTQSISRDPFQLSAGRSIGSLLPIASIVLAIGMLLATLPSAALAPAAQGRPTSIGAPVTIHVDPSGGATAASGSTIPEHADPGLDR